ncbi:MAG TPA: YheV family putative zinc ribbon protein [Pseudomonadales bacterium]|nr:YheV family putative zinc ribbon protein [Pseudomonadales bacterium]
MIKKRFIAGAACPKCKQLDKVYTYEKEGREYAACTQCDYLEARPTPEDLELLRQQQTPAAEEATHAIKWQK